MNTDFSVRFRVIRVLFIIFAGMKRWLPIAFLSCVVVFSACNRPVETQNFASLPHIDPALQAIDSLTWQQPDSALAVLLDYFARRDALPNDASPNASPKNDINDSIPRRNHRVSTTYDRHYAHLLLAELLYKDGYAQTNRTELRQAVAYFDSLAFALNDAPNPRSRHYGLDPQSPNPCAPFFFLAARAHYINGAGYYENDSTVEACQQYLKALDVMERHFEEKDLVGNKARFMALTYTHLTGLFSNLYLHEQAIFFGKEALEYYRKYHATPWHVAWIMDEIGLNYEMMNEYDSALFYYHSGLESLSDDKNLSYRDLTTRLAYCSYLLTKDWRSSLNQLYELMNQADSEKELLSRSLTIAEIFYHEALYDSAWLYLRKVYEGTKSIDSKKQAAEWLVEICKAKNRDEEAHEYADFLVPFANLNENQGFLKSQMAELYHDYEQQRLEAQNQQKMKQNQKTANKAMGYLFGLLTIVIVFYLVSKARQRQLILRQKETERQMESEQYAHEIQQKALAAKLRKSNDSLRVQSEMVAKLQESLEREQICAPQGDYEAFVHETPCHEIMESLKGTNIKRISVPEDYAELALSPQQLLSLAQATEKHFRGFESYLRHLYPKISAMDINICLLFLLGVNEKQASILLNRDYSTIMEHVRKMKKAFHIETNLRDFIRNGE